MKKLFIVLTILLTSLIFIPTAYAYETPVETRFDSYVDWSLVEDAGVKYLRSNRFEIVFDKYGMEIATEAVISSDIIQVFVEEDGLHKSRVEIYNTMESTARLTDFKIRYERDSEPPHTVASTEFMFLEGLYSDLGATPYASKFMEIVIIVNPELTTQQLQWLDFRVSQDFEGYEDFFWFIGIKEPVIIDPNQPGEIDEELPLTGGSIFTNKNDMGSVQTNIIGNNEFEFIIRYKTGTYHLEYTFAPETDVSMFSEDKEAFYFSDGEDKFIVFNDGDKSILTTTNLREEFIPYTIWNLSTNELVAYHQFNVYTYIKEGDANNYYAYFYTDEFVIDRLMSATVSMEYRYVPIIGAKGDWIPYFKILEDTTVSGNTVGWEMKAAAYATAAMPIALMIPGLRWPALIIGTSLTLYLQANAAAQLIDGKNLISGSINQIALATPTPGLKTEIDGAYQRAYPNFTGMNLNDFTLWKMHLGQFDKAFTKGVEINQEFNTIGDQKGLNIISMKYMTNGHIYTISGEEMNHHFNPGDMDVLPDSWNPKVGLDFLGDGLTTIIIGGVILLVVWQLLKKGAFTDMRKFLTFLIIAAIVLILLHFAGLISLPFFTSILRL